MNPMSAEIVEFFRVFNRFHETGQRPLLLIMLYAVFFSDFRHYYGHVFSHNFDHVFSHNFDHVFSNKYGRVQRLNA